MRGTQRRKKKKKGEECRAERTRAGRESQGDSRKEVKRRMRAQGRGVSDDGEIHDLIFHGRHHTGGSPPCMGTPVSTGLMKSTPSDRLPSTFHI